MDADDPRHGTRQRIREHRCKCETCRSVVARDQNLYKLRRSANGGQPLKVPKAGAVRRLHALMAIGWPRRELAHQAGYKGDAFAMLLLGDRDYIVIDTHARIADLYDRLCMTPGPSLDTRRRASKKGWPPPLAWDDIDTDPEPSGVTRDPGRPRDSIDEARVLRILAGDFTLAPQATNAERREVVARWTGTLAELERECGWKPERYAA